MFLKVLKNKPEPAPTSGKKSSGVQVLKKVPAEKIVTHASFLKQKEENLSFFGSDEVLDWYEHGKPFCYWWPLSEGLSELSKLHGWIMHDMKQGIHTVAATIPTWMFNNTIQWKLAIEFNDLHMMYRCERLDVNLITVWFM
jgi:hypothetical protein